MLVAKILRCLLLWLFFADTTVVDSHAASTNSSLYRDPLYTMPLDSRSRHRAGQERAVIYHYSHSLYAFTVLCGLARAYLACWKSDFKFGYLACAKAKRPRCDEAGR